MRGCCTITAGAVVRPVCSNSLTVSGNSLLEICIAFAVAARIDADDAERRVLREHVEEGERRAVGNSVLTPGRDPRDRPRDDEADEQLVALVRRDVGELEMHQLARLRTCRSREARSGTASARYFLKCGVCWCASKAFSSL